MTSLFENIERFKNKIALIGLDNEKYSYKKIVEKTKYINSKIQKRSIILIIAGNNAESIIGYVSFIRSNHLSILLDKSFKVEYAEEIIKKYKPNYIFGPKNYFYNKKKVCEVISLKSYVLIKTEFPKHKKINSQNLLLLSTSGTTQNPKFVRLSNKNLQNNTKNIINYLKINSNHNTITTMPIGYSYGLSIINTHLVAGSTIIVNNKTIFDKDFWNKIKKYKVTSFGGVPQLYEQLQKLKFENFNLKNLQYLTQAGGKLDKTFLKYFEKICKNNNIKFITMYGQTEASPRMSYLKWENFSRKFGSIGQPLDGAKFKIMTKNGKYTDKSFSVGELIYFGKNVCLGYARSLQDLKKGNENKGKLFTGDLAYKDEENHYYLVGRKNRISKIFGIRIDLDDIEKKLIKNNYKVKCISDNKYLKISIVNDYNTNDIKDILQSYYKINKNFIYISRVKRFSNQSYFKQIKKYNN